jgi:hypothetical protein
MRRLVNLLRSKRGQMEQDLNRELRYHLDRRVPGRVVGLSEKWEVGARCSRRCSPSSACKTRSHPPVSSDGKNETCDHPEIPGASCHEMHELNRERDASVGQNCKMPCTTVVEPGSRTGESSLESVGGADGDRTRDLLTASQALSHLSYSPTGD